MGFRRDDEAFLYFKQPRPYVDRKEKTSDPAEMVACKIIEKALAWDLAQFDFDSVIKYVRNDFLISGMGLAEENMRRNLRRLSRTAICCR